MDIKEKRARNFTDFDKNMLIEIVQSNLHIVENKKTDSANVKTKNEAWDLIARQFNASCQSGTRTAKQLHALYDGMKKKARKNMHDDKKEMYKTGGGVFTPKSDTIDTKIIETIGVQFKPLANIFDSSSEYLQDVIVYEAEEDKENKGMIGTSKPTEYPPINVSNLEYNKENISQLDVAPFPVESEQMMGNTSVSTSTPMKKRKMISSVSNLSATKKTNMDIITTRLVDRKNFKDAADIEIKNKKLKILDIEEIIKTKELEIKNLELQHLQTKHEMELQHIKSKQALELQILEHNLK